MWEIFYRKITKQGCRKLIRVGENTKMLICMKKIIEPILSEKKVQYLVGLDDEMMVYLTKAVCDIREENWLPIYKQAKDEKNAVWLAKQHLLSCKQL